MEDSKIGAMMSASTASIMSGSSSSANPFMMEQIPELHNPNSKQLIAVVNQLIRRVNVLSDMVEELSFAVMAQSETEPEEADLPSSSSSSEDDEEEQDRIPVRRTEMTRPVRFFPSRPNW